MQCSVCTTKIAKEYNSEVTLCPQKYLVWRTEYLKNLFFLTCCQHLQIIPKSGFLGFLENWVGRTSPSSLFGLTRMAGTQDLWQPQLALTSLLPFPSFSLCVLCARAVIDHFYHLPCPGQLTGSSPRTEGLPWGLVRLTIWWLCLFSSFSFPSGPEAPSSL